MMTKIYSKIQPGLLLHQVFRWRDATAGRLDIVHPDNFIQVSALKYDPGKTFPAHKHIIKERNKKVIAQESWVVISGMVKCKFFDLDGDLHCEEILYAGDLSVTLYGGHTYEILQEGTFVYEFKTGPYENQENDKVFI